jgi:hypothetical protein
MCSTCRRTRQRRGPKLQKKHHTMGDKVPVESKPAALDVPAFELRCSRRPAAVCTGFPALGWRPTPTTWNFSGMSMELNRAKSAGKVSYKGRMRKAAAVGHGRNVMVSPSWRGHRWHRAQRRIGRGLCCLGRCQWSFSCRWEWTPQPKMMMMLILPKTFCAACYLITCYISWRILSANSAAAGIVR